ncbi:MAG TPA: hypothetical protein VIK18_26735 [Pirellulales bacterium]
MLLAWQGVASGQETKSAEAMFRQLDTSADGVLTMDDATVGTRSYLERIFKAAGKGPSERLTHDEFLTAHARLRNNSASRAAKTPPASSPNAESAQSGDETPPKGIGFIDTDGDNAISRTEWSKFKQTFSRLDADKDNALDAAELQATGGAAELLMKLGDLGGDGKISRVEWGKLAQSFVRLDANRDSKLDLAELKKVADAAADAASGSASLAGGDNKSGAKAGPTVWRGRIEGRGQLELTVNGNHIVGREIGKGGGDDSLGAGTFTMTGDGKTGNMDAIYTEGNRAGQTCLGIYKLDGDTLLWCVNNRGGRPQSFASGGGGDWLLTLTRVTATSSTSTQ